MPLYEYKCRTCSEVVEVIRKVSDPPYTICPRCGGELKKLMSAPAIQFKGSGFYITDYARSGSKESESSKKTESEKPAKTKETTTTGSSSGGSSSGGSSTGGSSSGGSTGS